MELRVESMKILVTGANGFVGSHLCKYLVDRDEDVYAMVRETSDLTLLKDLNPDLNGINLVYGDILQIETLKELFKGKDAIISLAGMIRGVSMEDFDETNVDGNVNVCEATLAVNPEVERLVLTSSAAAAGPSDGASGTCEDDDYEILDGDLYGGSKRKMEQAVSPYFKKIPGLCIVRPPVVLGPGDMPSLDLYSLPKMGFKLVVGKDPHYYSIVAVQDLCSGIYEMVKNPKAKGETFYFATGDPIEWGELQDVIGRVVFDREKRLRNLRIPGKLAVAVGGINSFFGRLRKKAPFLSKTKMIEGCCSWACSDEKAKELLGWKSSYTIEKLVKEAGEWYKEHGYL